MWWMLAADKITSGANGLHPGTPARSAPHGRDAAHRQAQPALAQRRLHPRPERLGGGVCVLRHARCKCPYRGAIGGHCPARARNDFQANQGSTGRQEGSRGATRHAGQPEPCSDWPGTGGHATRRRASPIAKPLAWQGY